VLQCGVNILIQSNVEERSKKDSEASQVVMQGI
jgi:hypothetical protein